MKPAPFVLHSPSSLEEAEVLLADHGDEAKVLAGGQSLVPLLALRLTRFEHLVDLNRISSLQGISEEKAWLSIGSMTRQAHAERSTAVESAVPLLHRALPQIGHFQIRNRGTVGGSTAHADPASELPAVALALDAELIATRRGSRRTIPARDFFRATWTTALEADEILAEIRYPVWSGRCGFALEEFARRHGDFAIAGVACGVELGPEGAVTRAAIALFGMGPTPVRAGGAEAALAGGAPGELDLRAIARAAVEESDPPDDIHGTPSFRRRVAAHLIERALKRAIEEALNA
jgi:carbon-monoxide dehydrogenase medium subunit